MKLSMAVRVAVLIVGCLSLPACPTLSNPTQSCTTHESCGAGLYCVQGACQKLSPEGGGAPSHCFNLIKDEGESDVDCGGTCPTNFKCGEGKSCGKSDDCISTFCGGNVCKPLPTACSDQIRNNNESDQDCGGSDCKACADGKACKKAADCESRVCENYKCKASSCGDSVKNGSETDIDCGGKCPTPCLVPKGCLEDKDCATGNCNAETLTCQSASCTDQKLNPGSETDVDCGGLCSAKCVAGKRCNGADDCANKRCVNNVCAECVSNGDCSVFNECQFAQCENNQCVRKPIPQVANKACANGSGFCNGQEACVQCVTDAQCPAPSHECLSVSCQNEKCVTQAVASRTKCKDPNFMCNGNLQNPACTPCFENSDCPTDTPDCVEDQGASERNRCVCLPELATTTCAPNACGPHKNHCGKDVFCRKGSEGNADGCPAGEACVNYECKCSAPPAVCPASDIVCGVRNICGNTTRCKSCNSLSEYATCEVGATQDTCKCTNTCPKKGTKVGYPDITDSCNCFYP